MNVLVTGGSKGLGAEIVDQFLKKGWNVYNVSRSEPKIQQEIANAASSPANIVPEQFPAEDKHTASIGEPPGLNSDQALTSILNEKSVKND